MHHEMETFGRHADDCSGATREVHGFAYDTWIGIVVTFPKVEPQDHHLAGVGVVVFRQEPATVDGRFKIMQIPLIGVERAKRCAAFGGQHFEE